MMSIYKYSLLVRDYQEVALPSGCRVLSVQFQGDQLCLWAAVDTAVTDREIHRFRIYGTGHPMDDSHSLDCYIGTVQQHGGALVWHIFEV